MTRRDKQISDAKDLLKRRVAKEALLKEEKLLRDKMVARTTPVPGMMGVSDLKISNYELNRASSLLADAAKLPPGEDRMRLLIGAYVAMDWLLRVPGQAGPKPEKAKVKCGTCGGLEIVNTPWPSGYPHAFPCPECQPNVPCKCGLVDVCPGPDRVVEWRKKDEQAGFE